MKYFTRGNLCLSSKVIFYHQKDLVVFLREEKHLSTNELENLVIQRREYWNAVGLPMNCDISLFETCSFTEKIQEIYKAFIRESGIQFSELEEKVLQFHLSNLEYACGSNLSQVSFHSCVLTWLSSVENKCCKWHWEAFWSPRWPQSAIPKLLLYP